MDIERKQVELFVYKGDTFSKEIPIQTAAGVAVDLQTGYTARMQIKETADSTKILELAVGSGLTLGNGKITVAMTAAQTGAFDFTKALFDIELTKTADSDVRTVAYGTIDLRDDISDGT